MPKRIKEEISDESADAPEFRSQPTLEGVDLNALLGGDLFGSQSSQTGNNLEFVLEDVPSLSNINSQESLNLFSFVEAVEVDNANDGTALKQENGLLVTEESNNLQDPGSILFKAVCNTDSANSRCGTYSFSSPLNKLFVNMNVGIAFTFNLNPFVPGVIVRTTAVHETLQGSLEPVIRCDLHSQQAHALNEGFPYPLHFIRCSSTGTWYEVDEVGGFLSVCSPLPDNNNGCVPFIYRFMCRTSCIGKSAITMRFELMLNNEVLATDSLNVRVCACPMRDRVNEEKSVSTLQVLKPKTKCVEVFKVKGSATAAAGRYLSSCMIPTKKPR